MNTRINFTAAIQSIILSLILLPFLQRRLCQSGSAQSTIVFFNLNASQVLKKLGGCEKPRRFIDLI